MSTLSVDTIQGQTTAANVKLPAGSILQIQRAQIGGNITTTSSTPVASGLQKAITPKFATSLLHITASVHCYTYRSSTNNGGSVDINVDGSNVSASGDAREFMVEVGGASSIYVFCRQHKEVTISASNTNAKTIKLQMQNKTSADSGGFRINDGNNYTSSIKVEEIAQ